MTTFTIVHQLPGRIRMRVSAKRNDAAYFARLSEYLAGLAGVRASQVNAATGSVVVHYDGDADLLLARMREQIPHLVIENDHRSKNNSPIGTRPFRIVSGRQLSPMWMLGAVLSAVGVMQTFRGKIAVPSITAFWYALDSFRQSGKHRNEIP